MCDADMFYQLPDAVRHVGGCCTKKICREVFHGIFEGDVGVAADKELFESGDERVGFGHGENVL